MNPTLEVVLHSSPTVAFNVNKLSRKLAEEDKLFQNSSLNNVIVFKYPNFDVSEGEVIKAIASEAYVKGDKSVHTALFIPRTSDELMGGGFGIFLDDKNLAELLHRYLGLDLSNENSAQDMKILMALNNIPSLDPYILHDQFLQSNISANNAYFQISDDERNYVRNMITEKVKPIVLKALGLDQDAQIHGKLTKFIDAIWNPNMRESEVFIHAFGIESDQVGDVFSAWKGITFYLHEFVERRDRIVRMHDWLNSTASRPADYGRLKSGEKQQIDMFRKDVAARITFVQNNSHDIFYAYENSYKSFIENNEPKIFRDFLFKAHDYYWTLGACNGVLAQVCTAWERYYQGNSDVENRINHEPLVHMLQVCESLLQSHEGGHLGHV